MNPSKFPEIKGYPTIVKILEKHIDMWFEDIRAMLLLPLHKNMGGCNFATIDFICDIISGVSAILYKPYEGIRKDRFKEIMRNYYPWKEEGIEPGEGIKIIYNWVRNPITHRLGFLSKDEKPTIIEKSPLNIDQIEEIEDISKPIDLKTIEIKGDGIRINVLGLYRGLHVMLKKLFRNENEMKRTEEYWKSYFGNFK